MTKKTKARGNKSQPSFEKELGPLLEAIDSAVAGIPDEQQRQEVRQAVGEAVQGAIHHLARRAESPQQAIGTKAIGDGTQVAMDAVSRVQNLGFVEFTAGLINGTFNAITDATISQMKAYADLVANLAKTLAQFQAENVTQAEITKYLVGQFPDGSGGTSVRASYVFKKTAADPNNNIPEHSAKEKIVLVAETLVGDATGLVDKDGPLTFALDSNAFSTDTGQTYSFTSDWVTRARGFVGQLLAKTMIQHLRAMAREGMARIVITNGELLSKLTFRVESSEMEKKRESDYRSERLAASLGLRYGSRRFRVDLDASYENMKVNTVDSESFDSVTMSAEIIGQVKINFRTETFPPVVVDGPI